MRGILALTISTLLLQPAMANECVVGHAPRALTGVSIPAGKTLTLDQADVASVKNLGSRVLSVTLALRGASRQVQLAPGRREPADASLSLSKGTLLRSATCLDQAIDLVPITRGREATSVFRVLTDVSQSAVVGGRGDRPEFAAFYRVKPDALCRGLPPPGRFRVGPKVSPAQTVALTDLTWGVEASGARPEKAVRISLAGGTYTRQDVTVPPGQFRQTGPARFQALFNTRRSRHQVHVHRLGTDGAACWVRADAANAPSDNGVLVAVDTTNAVAEAREDNNQRPYGIAKP